MPTSDKAHFARSRAAAGIALVVVLGLGLGVRHVIGGALAKGLADALYTTFVFCLVLVVRPTLAPWRAGVVALAFSWLVEFAQLTPWPAELSARSVVFRLALGSMFNPHDLLWYVVGSAVPTAAVVLFRAATAGRSGPSAAACPRGRPIAPPGLRRRRRR